MALKSAPLVSWTSCPLHQNARKRACRQAARGVQTRVWALQTPTRKKAVPGPAPVALVSTGEAPSKFLEEDLVGEFSFSDVHLQRFSRLHATMRQCGYSFIIVAFATVFTMLAQVRQCRQVL